MKRRNGKRNVIIGMDTETLNGPPMTFQFFSKEKKYCDFIWTSAVKSVNDFFGYLDTLPATGDTYILYGHNLSFDALSLLWNKKENLATETVDFKYKKWSVGGVYSNLVFLKFTTKSKVIWLIDTFAFFPTSLAKLAEIFKPDLPKLKYPEGLGEKQFKKTDKDFIAYAMRDAEIAYYVGLEIDRLHDEYEIPQAVSRANMSAKIFRRKYVDPDKSIVMPKVVLTTDPPEFMHTAALYSYHGGKNGLYCEKNALYRDVFGLDITSAYPYAMSLLPSFYELGCYWTFECSRRCLDVPEFGIYCITGTAKNCIYPSLFDHKFKPLYGKIIDTWVTGFELNEALKSGEFISSHIFGFFYNANKDKNDSPWKNFAHDFYELKESAEKRGDKLYREFAKVVMNSLYGKTIEMTKIEGDEDGWDLLSDAPIQAKRKLGIMWHPVIASLITGHTRATIHQWEHKYKALHTSTDGIFTQIKPKEVSGLGGCKIDFFGDVWIGRNKLYIGYVKDVEKAIKDKNGEPIRSIWQKNRWIGKWAHHSFHEKNPHVLEQLIIDNKWDYEYIKCNKLKESLRSGWVPNKFEKREATLYL